MSGPRIDPAAGNRRIGLIIGGASVAMLGMSFAAVPLYEMFCAATGFGGRPQIADVAPAQLGKRLMRVRFDANVAPGLPWRFDGETTSVELYPGETKTVFYKVTNLASTATSGMATYNVAPDRVGGWFAKISCFCFSEQTLQPGEERDLPVVFFLDPALERDESMDGVTEVTLSYTYYAAKPSKPAAAAGAAGATGG